jgi:hypothetical protein
VVDGNVENHHHCWHWQRELVDQPEVRYSGASRKIHLKSEVGTMCQCGYGESARPLQD